MLIFPLFATHQYLGLTVAASLFILLHASKVGLPLMALWCWCLLSSLVPSFAPWSTADWIPQILISRTAISSAQAAFLLVLLPILALRAPYKWFKIAINIWAVAECIMLILTQHGLEMGVTFSSALLVIAIPLLFPGLLILVIPVVIGYTGATTLGVAGIMFLSYVGPVIWEAFENSILWGRGHFQWALGWITLFVIGAVTDPFQWHERLLHEITDSNGRVPAWQAFLDTWWNHFPHWSGTGNGTWEWIGPYIKNSTDQSFIWVHNDYLQMLMENGYIGFTLFVIATLFVLRWVWRFPKERSMALGLVVCMMTYFPLHWVIGQVLLLFVTKKALHGWSNEKRKKEKLDSIVSEPWDRLDRFPNGLSCVGRFVTYSNGAVRR